MILHKCYHERGITSIEGCFLKTKSCECAAYNVVLILDLLFCLRDTILLKSERKRCDHV